jgi:hypothetical protein
MLANSRFHAVFLVCLFLLATSLLRADTITFTFTLPQAGGGTANTFLFEALTGTGFVGATAELFDGNTLLGTSVNPDTSQMLFVWVSPSSPFTIVPAGVIDFSSFINGTIQGRIVVTTTSHFVIVPPISGLVLNATNFAGGIVLENATVTLVPEPSTLLLLGTGALALTLRAFPKFRSHSHP